MAEQRERRPSLPGWEYLHAPNLGPNVIAASAWVRRRRVIVISALELAELPDGSGDIGPQWHISVTRRGRRPQEVDIRAALRAFGMVGTEEDNHHPGNARHYWLPVDPARRVDCECKVDEETITDPDGYTWTNPRQGEGACRGCELEGVLGRPCPLHTKEGDRG